MRLDARVVSSHPFAIHTAAGSALALGGWLLLLLVLLALPRVLVLLLLQLGSVLVLLCLLLVGGCDADPDDHVGVPALLELLPELGELSMRCVRECCERANGELRTREYVSTRTQSLRRPAMVGWLDEAKRPPSAWGKGILVRSIWVSDWVSQVLGSRLFGSCFV